MPLGVKGRISQHNYLPSIKVMTHPLYVTRQAGNYVGRSPGQESYLMEETR